MVKDHSDAGGVPRTTSAYRPAAESPGKGTKVENRQASSMPANYDSIYSRNELEAIVAYLKSGNF